MNRLTRESLRPFCRTLVCVSLTISLVPSGLLAEVVTLNNGLQLEGRLGKVASLGDSALTPNPIVGNVPISNIVLIDDDLRRTFVSANQVRSDGLAQGLPISRERIRIQKRVARGGHRIGSVGPIIAVRPFDEFGNRTFTMRGPNGPLDVIQGITEITPTYTKVEGLLIQGNSYVWDMRIATSSIPRETLSKVMMQQIDPTNADDRLRIVRLYIQAERYEDARFELDAALKDFPELANLKKQITALHQLAATRLIGEIELRRDAGQHRRAIGMCDRFPSKGVAGETLLKVREVLEEYKEHETQGKKVLRLMAEHLAEIADEQLKARIQRIAKEIETELNITTLARMADYLRLADDESMSPDRKLSLAISGWLLGSGAGIENLAVSLSLVDVRDAVRKYFRARQKVERDAILAELRQMEGGTPASVAKLLAHMKPAVETPLQDNGVPGLYELAVAGLPDDPEITYHVQLPPEYDPYRRYPCVVTLNGAGTTPKGQIDWWAGVYNDQLKMRLGQADRRGYIVIAPQWTRPHQRKYEYSAREHAAVLFSLRDACRRFSIDTDRVFLSGHSMGGDAAWDIGLAHPDLWAGVIPIVATSGKYVERYWENGRLLPLYFVSGQMDGNKISENGPQWDRYLTKHTYDVVVVEYQGRGHEHFHDEIQRLFQWMKLQRRDFFPEEFTSASMRSFDNFFWWVELEELPRRALVAPVSWPPPSGVRPVVTKGRILQNNRISLTTGASRATVWLAPEMVDFQQRVTVSVNGRGRATVVEPSVEVLLEDVRTRGDRQHPFWAKVASQRGRLR